MNIQDRVELLVGTPKYHIVAYSIDESSVILFIDGIVPTQTDIPETIDGREIRMVKAA